MKDRSSEIIRQLNRLVNDRSLTPHVRSRISEAIQHINDLHEGVSNISRLYRKLSEERNSNRSMAASKSRQEATV